eukprot:352175-Chlamydomonas_euryale.AAC.6
MPACSCRDTRPQHSCAGLCQRLPVTLQRLSAGARLDGTRPTARGAAANAGAYMRQVLPGEQRAKGRRAAAMLACVVGAPSLG